jgi:hypothetical protein
VGQGDGGFSPVRREWWTPARGTPRVGLIGACLGVEGAVAWDQLQGRVATGPVDLLGREVHLRSESAAPRDQGPADPRLRAMPVMGWLRFVDPDEPKNAALPKLKIPPSLATSQ